MKSPLLLAAPSLTWLVLQDPPEALGQRIPSLFVPSHRLRSCLPPQFRSFCRFEHKHFRDRDESFVLSSWSELLQTRGGASVVPRQPPSAGAEQPAGRAACQHPFERPSLSYASTLS